MQKSVMQRGFCMQKSASGVFSGVSVCRNKKIRELCPVRHPPSRDVEVPPLYALTRKHSSRVKQVPVKESPHDQASYYTLEQLFRDTGQISQELVFQKVVPLYEIPVAVYRAQQTDDSYLAFYPELTRYSGYLLVLEEVDVERKVVKPLLVRSCHNRA